MSEQPGTRPYLGDPSDRPEDLSGRPGDAQGGPDHVPGRPDIGPPAPGGESAPSEQRGRRARLLGIGALILSVYQSLYLPIGLILSIAAITVGVKARQSASRTHGTAPGARAGIVMGLIGLVMSVFMLSLSFILRDDLAEYARCHEAANTITDETACRQKFGDQFQKKLHLKPGSIQPGRTPWF